MAECWRSLSVFLFVFLQRRFTETGLPRWTRLMSGIPASERWGMSLHFSTASKEQTDNFAHGFSDPRGHHCLQHHRGCDWVLRAAGFAAGVHRPSHYHSNCHPNWTFCFHHSRRTSRLSLGADGAVRLSCPRGVLDTECHLGLILMHQIGEPYFIVLPLSMSKDIMFLRGVALCAWRPCTVLREIFDQPISSSKKLNTH